MKKIIRQKGSSLIEVLIYVAIVAIIGTILAGYFIVAVNSEAEHAKRNAINSSVENIISILKYDITRTIKVGTPSLQDTASSTLELQTSDGVVKYYVDENNILLKSSGSVVSRMTEPSVKVSDINFNRREHYEVRLNATTTSIELNMTLKNRQTEQLSRTIDMSFMVGKDTL